MILNYKYKLYVTKHTRDLSRLVTSANFAWNHVVELARRYYKLYGVSLSSGDLQKHMAKLAKHSPFWSKLHSQSLQAICQKYDRTLKEHFTIKGRGFPRKHNPHSKGSVLYKGTGGYSLYDDGRRGVLVINKLGRNWKFKFRKTRPWGEVRNLTVLRDTDGCLYVVITCNVPDVHIKREESGSIGMDFGMKTFLTMSDGSTVDIPDYHWESLKETAAADRSYSLKRNAGVYGTSFMRARKHRQKVHRKVANRRADFHWKLAHELCRHNAFIAVETLNLNGMKRHKRWGRKISSLGYGEFIGKLSIVVEKYGTVVVKIDKWAPTSQTCSECGYRWNGTKDLSVREWVCPQCGCVHDRDVNAARNILSEGLRKYTGEGVPLAGSDSKSRDGIQPAQSRLGTMYP